MKPERRAIADAAKGWLYEEEALELHKLATGAKLVVEIGAYCGKSSIWLGDATEATGYVFSVDPHRGNPEMRVGGSCYDEDVMDGDTVDTFRHWRENIDAAELRNVLPVVTGSLAFANAYVGLVDLVFIDGDHDPDAIVADYMAWKRATVIAFHDAPLCEAACKAAEEDGRKLVSSVRSLRVYR